MFLNLCMFFKKILKKSGKNCVLFPKIPLHKLERPLVSGLSNGLFFTSFLELLYGTLLPFVEYRNNV